MSKKKSDSKKPQTEIQEEVAVITSEMMASDADTEERLAAAADEWAPDTTPLDTSDLEEKIEASSDILTFVHDPFQISTVDIAHAQANSDELDLGDEDLLSEELDDADADISQAEGVDTSEIEADSDSEDDQAIEASEYDADDEKTEDDVRELAAEIADELDEAEEELKLDPIEKEETLAKIASAMAEEQAKQIEQLQALAPDEAAEAAERLAKEIAEDVALGEMLRAEAEESEALAEETIEGLPSGLDQEEMQSCIEALLFMTDKPMSAKKLQELLGPEIEFSLFQEAITSLKDRYQKPHHGFELVDVGGGFQFRTKPGRAELAKKLAKVQTHRLSAGAMETLAIIAYRQPCMKEDIDKVRGVDSSHFVRGLLDKKLIEISGRSELPGRPMLYSTTQDFLEIFGLKDLSALPSLREIEQMIPNSQSKNPDDEDPRVREMRRMVQEMKSDTSTSLIYDPREDEVFLKEIRERVNSIPTSTPSIDEQKAAEKAAVEAAKAAAEAEAAAKIQQQLFPEGTSPAPEY